MSDDNDKNLRDDVADALEGVLGAVNVAQPLNDKLYEALRAIDRLRRGGKDA